MVSYEFKRKIVFGLLILRPNYPEYPQLFPPFEHQVSILDVLFNCGPEAPYYIWGWREGA